jgi:hypothetical protein
VADPTALGSGLFITKGALLSAAIGLSETSSVRAVGRLVSTPFNCGLGTLELAMGAIVVALLGVALPEMLGSALPICDGVADTRLLGSALLETKGTLLNVSVGISEAKGLVVGIFTPGLKIGLSVKSGTYAFCGVFRQASSSTKQAFRDVAFANFVFCGLKPLDP